MTPEQLRAATGCTQDRADLFAEHLTAACEHYGINTPQRLACFLGQIGHESGSLKWTRELAAGDAYEGRADLGNTQPGDGRRYRGRGLIQITGRDNYRAAARRMQPAGAPDFEADPEAVESPRWAAWTAADWWAAHGCNELADEGNVTGLSRLINRGSHRNTRPANGEADRIARTERAREALQVAPVQPPAEPAQPEAKPMAPFLLAALPSIIESIPKLGKLFGSGSAVSERNLKAAELVAATVTQAVGATNEQEAVAKLKSDPQAVAAATQAIDAIWYDLSEAGGGGIEGARKAAREYAMPDGPRFWLNPAFWISLILLAMPMMLLADVFYVHPESYTGEIRTQIVTGVLLVIGMVGGYWIGTSFSSAKKDERNRTPQ